MESIERAGEQLLYLIENILNASKADAGLLEITPVPTKPANFIEPTISLYRGLAHSRDGAAKLVVESGDGITQDAMLDRGKIQQVINNPISNAVKFTPKEEDGGVITLFIDVQNDMLKLTITDNGEGISEDDLPKLFLRFQQVGRKDKGGTGLGLSISKEIIELHGGYIEVKSTLGQGSVFTVVVPMTYSKNQLPPSTSVRPDTDTSGVTHIVVVDDNPMFFQAVKTALGDYRLTYIQDSRQAVEEIEKIAEDSPLLIIDIHMPHMSGWDVITKLRELPKTTNLPIIVYTSNPDSHGMAQAALFNVAYLGKPIHKEEFLRNLIPVNAHTPKVLIIDGDSGTQALLTRALKDYDIRTAADGVAGCAMIESFHPDAIILDLAMPRKDGFEVLHWLKSSQDDYYLNLPVIVYTAGTALSYEEQKRELQKLAQTIITKNGKTIAQVVKELEVILNSAQFLKKEK